MPRRGVTGERLVALFLLGVALFTPPWLGVFNHPQRILGLPLLYVYLFAAWGLLIALAALVIELAGGDEAFNATPEAPGEREE